MAINGLGAPLSGMQANQLRMDVSANNVANINTDGFKASTVQTGDRAYINDIGQGTQTMGTYAPQRPGPVAPAPTGGIGAAAGDGQGGGAAAPVSDVVELSNTDPAAEMTSQMGAQSAYGFNVSMLQTANEMTRSVLDIMA